MDSKKITAEIFRFDPQEDNKPYYKTYIVNTTNRISLQELIRYIHNKIDSTLSFRNYNCYQGICSCCAVKLNGKNVKACCTIIRPGEKVRIEPCNFQKVIKDLVTSF